jgi:hypothetical protein
MRRGFAGLASVIAGLALLLTPALAAAKPSVRAIDGDELTPGFAWSVRTYGARCEDGKLDLAVRGGRGWLTKTEGRRARRGNLRLRVRLESGQATAIAFRRRGGERRRFWIRCLPASFPPFEFERERAGGPEYFFTQMGRHYAVIFDRGGAPVWWLKSDGSAGDAKLLRDGTISMNTGSGVIAGDFEIRTLEGRLVRKVGPPDRTDVHDLQLLPNGNYVIGLESFRGDVDASAFGGSANAAVLDTRIEERTPDGEVLRSWDSGEHIGLEETGRWWPEILADTGALWYDISHWNAVDVDGRFMYLSFRNEDAIDKVDRRSGEIIWKLGGTETPQSLEVLNDPHGDYPLGGQHDVRVLADGSVTVFDNRTGLADATPSAERFRIDQRAGTAKLVESIGDERVKSAFCCGSARRLPSGDWLVSWGDNGIVGAYQRDGDVIFRLLGGFTYRANPVADGALGQRELRRAMDRLYGR